MTPDQIKIKELETQLAATAKERDTFKGQTEVLSTQLTAAKTRETELNDLVKNKNNDIVQLRRANQNLKKVSDMSEDEKAKLSESELAILERQEMMENELETQRKEAEDRAVAERNSRYEQLAKKYAGEDSEYAEKIKANISILKGSDAAITEEEYQRFAEMAVNLVPKPAADPVQIARNANGQEPNFTGGQGGEGAGFADTDAGKTLADALGLSTPTQ